MAAKVEGTTLFLKTRVQLALLGFIVILTFFLHLGMAAPNLMEARNFITAREITQNNAWLIPTMNGHVRLAKPPLPTWITTLAGLGAGNMENLAALRFPSSVMASLTVFFLFFLARLLSTDRLVPFLAATVLASSFLFINTGRQATWDIYCHSFMLGAIWLLVSAVQKPGTSFGLFAASGILLGCSYLSKGPVAFFALLLPFLLAYGFAFPLQAVRKKRSGLLLTLVVCVLVSFSWPMYVYLMEPGGLSHTVSQESTAWVNRHVKPVWYYWGFFAQSGIWTPFLMAAMVVPYARSRVARYGNYQFLLSWILLTLLLLSILPEKKERYLLPLLIPMALLTAHYLRYLISVFSEKWFSRCEKAILLTSGYLFALIAFAVPIYTFFMSYTLRGEAEGQQVAVTLLFLLLGIAIVVLTRSHHVTCLVIAAALLNALGYVFVMPYYLEMKALSGKRESVPELEEVRNRAELKSMKFYAIDGMRPENVWEVGKTVDTLKILNGHLQLPVALPAAVFSLSPLPQTVLPDSGTSLYFVGHYQYMDDVKDKEYHLYILSRNIIEAEAPISSIEQLPTD